ncbi:MAG: hypothetical protein M3Y87_24140 [Myxococcota bacterium]|nr:hypothetical protein [Myxococcota bacterium]
MRLDDPRRPASQRLQTIHRRQIERDGWPDVDAFDPSSHPLAVRRNAAYAWHRRACEEYESIHEFTALGYALTRARAPIELLGALSRLVTDEVRHAELASRLALALCPEERDGLLADFRAPALPYPRAPERDDESIRAWAADAILCSCCIGEELSRPLFEAIAVVATERCVEDTTQQILKDEHLHAAFGWAALAHLLGELGETSRAWLEGRLAHRLAGFESTCRGGLTIDELANTEVVIARGGPNLGILERVQYATIFYATLESEILPRFRELGFDADRAWQTRPRVSP